MRITNQRKHINPNIFNALLNKKSHALLRHCKHSNLSFATLTASTNLQLKTPLESLRDPWDD